jgi:hypothetical protein
VAEVNTPCQMHRDRCIIKKIMPRHPPEKTSSFRTSKANPVFDATVSGDMLLVCIGAFLAGEPDESHHSLNQSA